MTTKPINDTPETYALVTEHYHEYGWCKTHTEQYEELQTFACKLERERDAAISLAETFDTLTEARTLN